MKQAERTLVGLGFKKDQNVSLLCDQLLKISKDNNLHIFDVVNVLEDACDLSEIEDDYRFHILIEHIQNLAFSTVLHNLNNKNKIDINIQMEEFKVIFSEILIKEIFSIIEEENPIDIVKRIIEYLIKTNPNNKFRKQIRLLNLIGLSIFFENVLKYNKKKDW